MKEKFKVFKVCPKNFKEIIEQGKIIVFEQEKKIGKKKLITRDTIVIADKNAIKTLSTLTLQKKKDSIEGFTRFIFINCTIDELCNMI